MGHLVRYESPEGEERYIDVEDLDAAVQRVEKLHNEDGIRNVRVYREVPLEVRTYVKVAVAGEEGSASGTSSGASVRASGSSADAPSGAAVISPPPASAASQEAVGEATQADTEARAAENRRVSLFNRGQAS